MCIRDRCQGPGLLPAQQAGAGVDPGRDVYVPRLRRGRSACLLYTSDAADDLLCVDLGGRRIIKKKKYQPLTL